MSLQGHDSITVEPNVLAAYRGQLRAKAAFGSARVAALRAGLVELWPVTMIALALGLTLVWTGLLARLVWWGIERLI
jgi:uncharacterized iron-regulated membrane protein